MKYPLKNPILDFDISTGARIEYSSQIWEITFIDRHREEICCRKVHGSETFYFTFARFAQKFKHKKLTIVRKTPPLTVMALTAATLDNADREAFEGRCAYVKLANEFETGAPKKDLMAAVTQLWSLRNEKAASENRAPEKKAPSYSRLKHWQRMVLQFGNLFPLAYNDHRNKPRATRLDPEVETLLQNFTQSIYVKNKKTNATDVHDAVSIAVKQSNREVPAGSHPLKVPCRDTIERRLAALDPIWVDLNRKGKEFVRKNYNYGAAQYIPSFIGSMVQCDCHQLDLFIYDNVLGIRYRPWLMVFIDCHTRCIIGWELSALAPSAEKAMRCFKNAIAESADHRYRCVPSRLIFDNGVEFINDSIKTVAGILLCIIEYGQVRTPNSKSIVERFFRTLNAFIHKLSGTTFSNILERADYDSEGNAIYTLDEIRQLFAEFLRYYHIRKHSQLQLAPDTQWRLTCENQEPRIIDAESAATLGTSMRRCSIRSGRIGTKGVYWHSPALPQLQASLAASGDTALLHYDNSDLSHAWVRHPRHPHEVIRCDPVLPHYQKGLTMQLHEAITQEKKEYEAATQNEEQAQILRAAFTMKAIHDLESKKNRKTNRARASELSQLLEASKHVGLDLNSLFSSTTPTTIDTSSQQLLTSTSFDDSDDTHDDADYSII